MTDTERTIGGRPDFPRNRRCELLAAADRQALLAVADACIESSGPPVTVLGPDVGTVVMPVREPVERIRFHLGDVLVSRSEVEHRGCRGWAVRMGDDRAGALAAAICDAEVETGGPRAADVLDLCRRTEGRLNAERRLEWEQLEPTIVNFEEMGE